MTQADAAAPAHAPRIEIVESGEGPPLLFVPGSYATPAAWRPLQRRLAPCWRLLATSLCGYGQTGETRTLADHGMAHEVRIVEAVARHARGPVHLVGHSFGGTVALATALAGRVEVASLALFEANPVALLRHVPGGLHDSTWRMSRAFEAAVQGGERDAAARIIDFWGEPGAFAAMPEVVQDYCRRTTAANVLDWRTCFGFEPTAADLRRLDLPVLLVRGALANPAMVSITDQLAAALPHARAAVVDGAGHFLISSHPAECAGLLEPFLDDAGARRDAR